jgi:hypothetical protein
MRYSRLIFYTGVLAAMLFAASAQAFTPIRNPMLLWQPVRENVRPVTSARVILADYALIRRDFPEIQHLSNSEVDAWLIRNSAFVSQQQAAQTVVNDPIPTSSEMRTAYRPREYRRAHVFVADTGGLIDAKGTGAIDPSGGSHDNGLATLGDMIREYLFEKLVHAVFEKDGRFDTVGSYAVIDFGFDIKHPDGERSRAGIILRQAHRRYHGGPLGTSRGKGQVVTLPRELSLEIEILLRKHGITSAQSTGRYDVMNLQGAESGAVIDFGSFLVKKDFYHRVAYAYDKQGNPLIWSDDFALRPELPGFPQPLPQSQIPFEIWGYSQTGKADSKYDNPYIWSHDLAEALKTGRASRQDVEQHVRNMFDIPSVQNALRHIPRSCQVIFAK